MAGSPYIFHTASCYKVALTEHYITMMENACLSLKIQNITKYN